MLSSDLRKMNKEQHVRRQRVADMQADRLSLRNDLMPRCSLEMRRTDDLQPPKRSLRKNDKLQIDRVCEVIRTIGFRSPILITEEGSIVDGLSRWHAAKRLALPEIPCIIVHDANAQDLRILRLAVNKLPQEAEWSIEDLKLEFEELIAVDAPIEVTGFSTIEVDQILSDDSVDGIENGPIEASSEHPQIAQKGDIFQLGDHFIGCGNATDDHFVILLLTGKYIQLAIHDPPYNLPTIDISTTHTRDFLQGAGEMSPEEFTDFIQHWLSISLNFMIDGALIAIFCDWRISHLVTTAALKRDLAAMNTIIWAKTSPALGSFYRSQHEFMQLYKHGTGAHINNIRLGKNGRSRSNLWTYPGASSIGSDPRKGLNDHPTVKPVALLKDFIIDVTKPEDWIYDAFLGSGSTLIAAEQTGRRCVGLDLDPRYVDVAIRRWETATGRKAVKIMNTERPPLPIPSPSVGAPDAISDSPPPNSI